MTDQIKERIRFNTELLRLISVFLIADGGGAVALILGGIDSGRKIVFVSAGILTTFVLIAGFYRTYKEIQRLLEANVE